MFNPFMHRFTISEHILFQQVVVGRINRYLMKKQRLKTWTKKTQKSNWILLWFFFLIIVGHYYYWIAQNSHICKNEIEHLLSDILYSRAVKVTVLSGLIGDKNCSWKIPVIFGENPVILPNFEYRSQYSLLKHR